MLKLSTKGRYGVRLMLDLASQFDKGPISLKGIASRQEISEKYLWQLIPLLKKAGFLVSTRGVKGGYMLTNAPSKINLNDIITVLEGKTCLVNCVSNPSVCKRSRLCVTRDVWKETAEKIKQTLASFTLEKMLNKQKYRSEHPYNISTK